MSAAAPDKLAELEQRIAALEQAQGDELQPGVFSINAAGELVETIGQLHANGIVLPLGSVFAKGRNEKGENIPSLIAWEETREGEPGLLAHIVAYDQTPKPPAINPVRIVEILAEGPDNVHGERATGIQAIQSREEAGFGQVRALASSNNFGNGAEVQILNSLGESDFARFVGQIVSNKLKFQIGATEIFDGSVGVGEIPVNLHVPWEHEHLFWVCSLHALASLASVFIVQSGPFDGTGKENLAKGTVWINSGVAQAFIVYWLSVGR